MHSKSTMTHVNLILRKNFFLLILFNYLNNIIYARKIIIIIMFFLGIFFIKDILFLFSWNIFYKKIFSSQNTKQSLRKWNLNHQYIRFPEEQNICTYRQMPSNHLSLGRNVNPATERSLYIGRELFFEARQFVYRNDVLYFSSPASLPRLPSHPR